MNPNELHPITIVILALVAIAIFLVILVAGIMCSAGKAEPPPNTELDIPADREFKEADCLDTSYAPCTPAKQVGIVPARQGPPRGPSGNSVLSPQSSRLLTFPHDTDYEFAPHKRF